MKKRLLLLVLVMVVLTVVTVAEVRAEQDIMVWNPRTPAGGAYVPDPMYWFNIALVAKYGERAIHLYAPPITTNYYSGEALVFGGTTNFVTQSQVDTFTIIGTDFNAQSGSMSINVGN